MRSPGRGRHRRCLPFAAVSCAILAAVSASAQAPTAPPNLLSNGDFEKGAVGFSSDYGVSARSTTAPGQEGWLTVADDPRRFNPLGASFGDHTTGRGRMLVVNGATAPGRVVWSQTVRAFPNTRSEFRFWVASWGRTDDSGASPNPAHLVVRIDGGPVGEAAVAPAKTGVWAQWVGRWAPPDGTTRATLTITDENTEFLGNDFALDDLSFTQAPP